MDKSLVSCFLVKSVYIGFMPARSRVQEDPGPRGPGSTRSKSVRYCDLGPLPCD